MQRKIGKRRRSSRGSCYNDSQWVDRPQGRKQYSSQIDGSQLSQPDPGTGAADPEENHKFRIC